MFSIYVNSHEDGGVVPKLNDSDAALRAERVLATGSDPADFASRYGPLHQTRPMASGSFVQWSVPPGRHG